VTDKAGRNLSEAARMTLDAACSAAMHSALAAWLVRRWGLPERGRHPRLNYSISCITATPVMQEMAHRRHAKPSVASCSITLKQETL